MTTKSKELLAGLPNEVHKYLETLEECEWDDELDEFNILHLYPGEVCYPNGYYDSRFFEVIGYYYGPNIMVAVEAPRRRNLGEHDSLDFLGKNTDVDIIRVFIDGSTLIRFKKPVSITRFGQNLMIGEM